jgi:hypothetical protein
MSILKSTNSGSNLGLSVSYLLQNGWNRTDMVGYFIYRNRDEGIHQSMEGEFTFHLKIRYVTREKIYILKLNTINDVNLVIRYFDTLEMALTEKTEFEALLKSIDFKISGGVYEAYEMQARYRELLNRQEEQFNRMISAAEEELMNHLVLLDTIEEPIEDPSKYSRII